MVSGATGDCGRTNEVAAETHACSSYPTCTIWQRTQEVDGEGSILSGHLTLATVQIPIWRGGSDRDAPHHMPRPSSRPAHLHQRTDKTKRSAADLVLVASVRPLIVVWYCFRRLELVE